MLTSSIVKRIFGMLLSFIVIISLLGNVTYAYSLDDVKHDYKRFKIKKHSGILDSGRQINWREGQIMKLQSSSNGNLTMLRFYLYETPTSKYVEIKLYHTSPGWAFWDRLTLGDGNTSYDIFPVYAPARGLAGLGWIAEQLTFRINNRNDFYKWKNAIQVRVKGQKYYDDFVIKKDEYNAVMRVTERFLFE